MPHCPACGSRLPKRKPNSPPTCRRHGPLRNLNVELKWPDAQPQSRPAQ